MKDFGITVVGGFTWESIRDDFRKEFNEATNKKENGLYTYFMCRYHDLHVSAECVYSIVDNNAVTFYLDPAQYLMRLDRKFRVERFGIVPWDINSGAEIFGMSLGEKDDIAYLGDQCDSRGNNYMVFTINNQKMIDYVRLRYPDAYPVDSIIRLGDDPHPYPCVFIPNFRDLEIIQELCAEFMGYVTQHYTKQIEEAMLSENAEGIEGNPFQDKFFDREETDTEEEAPKIYE